MYMYDQLILLRASANAMRGSSFSHPLVLQGEWVKKYFYTPENSYLMSILWCTQADIARPGSYLLQVSS